MTAESTSFRWVKKHSKRTDWHQWWLHGDTVLRGNTGRKIQDSSVRWFVLRCNNTRCSGEAIVNQWWMASQVPLGIGGVDEQH